jgi:3'(2'), 5'-bisphosphate nucleotidase
VGDERTRAANNRAPDHIGTGETGQVINDLVETAERAGKEILAVYGREFAHELKADDSPVTEADLRAEALILEALAELAPEIPVVAEESVTAGDVPQVGDGPFFLVDPLDGTREFISRNGEFTVNIALVEGRLPRLGVVHMPALDETFWGERDSGAWRRHARGAPERIRCRAPGEALVVVASRSHRDAKTDEYLRRFEVAELISAGSSLKFCRVAQGLADLYPRLGRTMEWDVAAGHAVLLAAGGGVETIEGEPLHYAKPGFENPHFVAHGLRAGSPKAGDGRR